jgi:hypothetical protein
MKKEGEPQSEKNELNIQGPLPHFRSYRGEDIPGLYVMAIFLVCGYLMTWDGEEKLSK